MSCVCVPEYLSVAVALALATVSWPFDSVKYVLYIVVLPNKYLPSFLPARPVYKCVGFEIEENTEKCLYLLWPFT